MSRADNVAPGDGAIEVLQPEDLVGAGEDILVVDDDQLNLVAMESALAPLGRRLVSVQSGVDALAKLLEQDFALILLDVAMPGMSGFETAAMIRTRRRTRTTPIIFITGLASQDDLIDEGYEVGGYDFLVKPVRPEMLRAKARVFLQLQERTNELQRKILELRRAQETVDQKEAEAGMLEGRVDQLAEIDRRKDEFLAILGHELRNPLQSLQMAVELLRDRPPIETAERVHKTIERRVHHMSRLVDDLLDVARFTAGTLELQREPVPVREAIEQALEICRAAALERKHDVSIAVQDDQRAVVLGDPVRLVQVFTNVLDNAMRYTASGGSIEIHVRNDGPDAAVRIADNGRGIRAELLPRIFEMFVRDRATSDGHGGLGLGLGLVKRLVELHGGTVRAASDGPGRGASFEIRLPLATGSPADPITTRRDLAKRPLRIVVCDDAEDIRDLLADMLRMYGHTVTVVAKGAAAIVEIVRDTPDVALVDLGLPDVDGFEVARAVRAKLGARAPRMIAVSGYGQEVDRANALEAGFDAHLVKPTPLAQLLAALYAP